MMIRALTVWQPWGTAIIDLGKLVENRSTNVVGSFRGLLAVHAGLKVHGQGFGEISRITGRSFPATMRLYLGHLIGVVDLVDVHQWPCPGGQPCSPWAEQGTTPVRSGDTWVDSGVWHLQLANSRPLPRPFPATGRQGLWRLTADEAANIAGQLGVSIDAEA